MAEQGTIFVSYSHADTKWLKDLDPHLRGLERYAQVRRFDDRQLLGGDDWDADVKAALDSADVVLLLVTANFIGSEYIHKVELPIALRRRSVDGCIIIPLFLESCYRKLLQIDDINYLPKDDSGMLRPLAEWRGAKRAKGLMQVIEHIHRQLERRAASPAASDGKSGIDLAQYRKRAHAKWSAIDLSALAAPGAVDADVTIRLSDIFVPLLARRSRPPVSLPRDYLSSQEIDAEQEEKQVDQISEVWQRAESVPALSLIGECSHRHLVLLGDPGAGKSALARFVLLQILDGVPDKEAPLSPLLKHVPFLIELRDFVAREAEGRCSDLFSYLAYCGEGLGFGFDAKMIEDQLSSQPSLLIIDGLDEIFDPVRRRLMVEQLIGMLGRYPQLNIFVTSRIAGFDDHPFRSAEFLVATLVDLTPELIEKFASDWFAVVFPGDNEAASRTRDDLLDAIRRRPQLRAIAGNPMILTIMATVARHKRLARSRSALYAQALELLCYNWDYKRGLGLSPDSPLIDLQADDTLLMLRQVAWQMQEDTEGLRANAIGESALREVVENFFTTEWHFDGPKARRAAGEMLKRLEERNWVLTLRGPRLYGFVHRTFLEYLCALEIAERFKSQQLDVEKLIAENVRPRIRNDAWHEVLRLLMGALPPAAAEKVLLSIIPKTFDESQRRAELVLAWQAISEIEPRHISTMNDACSQLTNSIYAWLAAETDDNLSTNATDRIAEAAQSIGQVNWPKVGVPEKFPRYRSKLAWTYPHIIAQLSKTVWSCPNLAVERISKLCMSRKLNADSRSIAFLILIVNFGEQKLVVDTMKSLLNDNNVEVRRSSIEHFTFSFIRMSDQFRPLIHERAACDEDGGVRAQAFMALAASLDWSEARILSSSTLEPFSPGLDPKQSISADIINRAAEKLNKSPDEICDLYQRLGRELKLHLTIDY